MSSLYAWLFHSFWVTLIKHPTIQNNYINLYLLTQREVDLHHLKAVSINDQNLNSSMISDDWLNFLIRVYMFILPLSPSFPVVYTRTTFPSFYISSVLYKVLKATTPSIGIYHIDSLL